MDWTTIGPELLGSVGAPLTWWQMSLRGLVVFLFGLALLRVFGRTAFGKQSPLDIVVAIVAGSNLSRTLTGNAPLLPTFAATALLVLCHWALTHLAARWHGLSRLVKGDPVPLLRDGRPLRQRMWRAGVSEGDVLEAARRAGTARLEEVEEAVLERSGKISAIRRREGEGAGG